MLKEKDIMHECGSAWVLRTRTGYTVCENKGTHSETCVAEWPLDADGLSLAIAYCNYRGSKIAMEQMYKQLYQE